MNVIIRNIPNSITCLNIASGVMAILCAFRGTEPMWGLDGYSWCWIFIGLAALADFCDGFAARLLHAYSSLGKELDSLCDLVSFGVAPAVLMFMTMSDMGLQDWTPWLVFIIPVCGALRLARFNIDDRQHFSFIGLPIPANAIFWIGYSALCLQGNDSFTQWYWFLPVILAESWLMVSPVKFFSLKFKTYGWKGNRWRWLMAATAILPVAIMGVPGLLWTIVVYLGYSLLDIAAPE